MMRLAASESGFKPSVKHAKATAAGLFQFIDATWRAQLKKYGPKFGIPPNAHQSDARANALIGAQFVKDNLERRSAREGLPPSAAMAYLDHWLGEAGANRFFQKLKTSPGEIVTNGALVGNEFTLNQALAREGGKGRILSVAETYQNLDRILDKKGRDFGVVEPLGGGGGFAGIAGIPSPTNFIQTALNSAGQSQPQMDKSAHKGFITKAVQDIANVGNLAAQRAASGGKSKGVSPSLTGGNNMIASTTTNVNKTTEINTTVKQQDKNNKSLQKGQRANRTATA